MLENIVLFFGYLVCSVISIQLALTIFGIKSSLKKVLLVAALNASFDYLIKEVIIPNLHLFDGLHLFPGIIFLTLVFRLAYRFNIIGSLCVTILSYILSGLGEFIIIIILMATFGIEFFEGIKDSKILISFYGVLGLLTLLIPLFYLKKKNIQLIKLPLSDSIKD